MVGTGAVTLIDFCRQTQLRNLFRQQTELHHRLAMGIRIDHPQPSRAHPQRLAMALPTQQATDLSRQSMIIKPRKLQAEIVTVQVRQPFGRTARHPPGQPLDTGCTVLSLTRQVSKT